MSEVATLLPEDDLGRQALKREEEKIKASFVAGFEAFVELGESLTRIQTGKLYKHVPGYPDLTFKDYCWGRLGLSESRVYQAIDAAAIVAATSTTVELPIASEFVARELRSVLREGGADRVREAWEAVAEEYIGKSPPSAREARKVLLEKGFRHNALRAASGRKQRAIFLGAVGEKITVARKRLKWFVDTNLGKSALGPKERETATRYADELDAMLVVMRALAAGERPPTEEL